MLLDYVRVLDPIEPEEIAMLQRVFDHACNVRSFSKESVEAADLAALIVNLYQHGVQEERQLIAMVL